MAKQVSIQLDDQTFAAVKDLAVRRGISVSALLEDLLRPIGAGRFSNETNLPAVTQRLLGAFAGKGVSEGE